ncbi:MAG: tRNA pseudouridine(38-40) synthase TruA [Planctomycetota bacterium]
MSAAAEPVLRTLRVDLEYDGAAFAGWQRQAADRTVQGVLEEALERLLSAPTPVVGAGRTDAGVHALGAVASFRTPSELAPDVVLRALDALLPDDVGVLAVSEAPGFHALRDARWKWYRYTWLRSRTRRVHERRTSWRVEGAFDLDAVRAAAARLRGRHDFACFQSSGSPRRSTVRTLAGVRVLEDGPRVHLDLVGDGFLYGMVRAVAGTLFEVGRGARDEASVDALVAGRDRRRAGPAAPAHGLVLVRVGYAADPPPDFVDPSLAANLESDCDPEA